ncbi:hypothetical protein C8R43DRAFT_587563 [Mycena crocata]|nr:hypothetical protein C8R43DRAFT_587563 [Mycena crocata]
MREDPQKSSQDGSTFLTSVDASQVHHVICDTCNGDIILTTDANPHRFLEHRKECLPNAKVDTVGDAAEVTLPASQTAGTRRYPHEQPNQHPHKRKRSPDEDLRLPPPKLTMASGSVVTPYDTLGALLLDLNRLLHAPHDDPELNFMGECPVIWEITGADAVQTDALHATLDVEETVRAAAWAVIRHTVLAFECVAFVPLFSCGIHKLKFTSLFSPSHSIHSLTIQTTQRSALAQTQSAAIWMGAPSSDPLLLPKATAAPMSCDHCEHLLTIGVRPRNAVGVQPEEYRILISLRHAPA